MSDRPQRDLALDLLRGYFLFVIMVDHLRYAVNPLYLLSGRMSLWVTAAEGFVLVSGYLVGKLRGAEARREGLGVASRRLVRRAAVLALWSVILTVTYRVISTTTGYWPEVPNWDEPGGLLQFIGGAVVLRRTYGDHNLLAAYALFLLAAPLGLFAMQRGRTLLFLAASAVLWAAGFAFRLRWSTSVQADACWQLLFAVGMAGGYHEAWLARRLAALTARGRRTLLAAGATLTVAILGTSAWLTRLPVAARPVLENDLFDLERLGPGRLVCALIVVSTLYGVVDALRARLVPTLGKLLIPLGQSSLYVYIVQSMLTFVLVDRTLASPILALVANVAMIALVWLLVRNRVLFGIIPR